MAKNYSAKLSLKDTGMLSTLKKAVETVKLKLEQVLLQRLEQQVEAKVLEQECLVQIK